MVGDPLGKATFQVLDNNSSINLQCMQEVIIFDETVAITPDQTIPLAFSDGFTTNTSGDYTQTYNSISGSAATWTWSV